MSLVFYLNCYTTTFLKAVSLKPIIAFTFTSLSKIDLPSHVSRCNNISICRIPHMCKISRFGMNLCTFYRKNPRPVVFFKSVGNAMDFNAWFWLHILWHQQHWHSKEKCFEIKRMDCLETNYCNCTEEN